MDDRLSETLGQRIVELARIATAMHLEDVLCGPQDYRRDVDDEKQRVKSEE